MTHPQDISAGARPAPDGAPETIEAKPRTVVFVCHGPSCSERGGPQVFARLNERAAEGDGPRLVRVCQTTCLDSCATGPNVVVGDEGHLQTGVLDERIESLADFVLGGEEPLE